LAFIYCQSSSRALPPALCVKPMTLADSDSVAGLSVVGCIKRHRNGTLWWFRRTDRYLFPNTCVLSQVCFAAYSLRKFIPRKLTPSCTHLPSQVYIAALVTSLLRVPTVAAYGFSLAAYIPLGLAIHFQVSCRQKVV
jgi:hypothetical protein